MTFRIRLTVPADAPLLPAIEQSAGELFRSLPDLAWIADGDDIAPQRHLELIAGGACWVAKAQDGALVGFLAAQPAARALHLWELSVRQDHQQRGIGRALVATAFTFAREQGLDAITLSTFRDVPWNEPFYRSLGFKTLGPCECDDRLNDILRHEIAAGLPGERRCAMRLDLTRTSSDGGGPARTIAPHHAITPAEIDAVEDRLYDHNQRMTGRNDAEGLAFVIRDEQGRIIAACAGYSWAGSAELKQLWIDERLRGQGYGRQLLADFIAEAKRRGVGQIWVASYSFQAPEFYEHAGFERVSELVDWPAGHSNVLLRMVLAG